MSKSREETPETKPFIYKTIFDLLPGYREPNPNEPRKSPFNEQELKELRRELDACDRRRAQDWADLAYQFVGHENIR